MAKLQVTGGAQFIIFWDVDGTECMTVLGGRSTGSGTVTPGTATAFATIVANAYNSTGMPGLQESSVSITKVSVRDVNVVNQVAYEASVTGAVGTGTTSQTLPRGAAVCVTHRTAKAGKSYRGRSYIPGFNEAQNEAGSAISAAAGLAAEQFIGVIHNNMSTTGFNHAVLSPALPERQTAGGETLPAKPSEATECVGTVNRNHTWASQRQRNHRL